ncbi:hypothetical protein PROFUN_11474 [Planoprotostelium fungivorum]|uniref:Uncharacterized protein n=1 Tax=Planoprotostelium fungivorum TaxID=1890364 RepID=A0A2P6N9V0_9EUKA|nr:hypothetical protein PROFUN_11474 [Planoprotostelium fungivorum]
MSGKQFVQEDLKQPPEVRFDYGVQMVQDAFEDKIKELSDEIAHLKNINASLRQQVVTQEDDMRRSQFRIKELEQIVTDRNQERVQLTEERNAAVDQINSLKFTAQQLQQFKKSIINMVERDHTTLNRTTLDPRMMDEATNNFLARSSNAPPSPNTNNYSTKNFSSSYNNIGTRSAMTEPNRSMSQKAKKKEVKEPEPASRYHARSEMGTRNEVPPEDVNQRATHLYKQIKQVLNPSDYSLFGNHINHLNNGANPEFILSNIAQILNGPAPHLFSQLQNLINQASDGQDT